MKSFTSTPPSSPAVDLTPVSCPACQSSALVTTAKSPDAESYWRCKSCGEIWNVSRSQADRHRGRHWTR